MDGTVAALRTCKKAGRDGKIERQPNRGKSPNIPQQSRSPRSAVTASDQRQLPAAEFAKSGHLNIVEVLPREGPTSSRSAPVIEPHQPPPPSLPAPTRLKSSPRIRDSSPNTTTFRPPFPPSLRWNPRAQKEGVPCQQRQTARRLSYGRDTIGPPVLVILCNKKSQLVGRRRGVETLASPDVVALCPTLAAAGWTPGRNGRDRLGQLMGAEHAMAAPTNEHRRRREPALLRSCANGVLEGRHSLQREEDPIYCAAKTWIMASPG